MALTNKQRAFVTHYVGGANWNASEAARRAGYKHPGQQGYRLLKNIQVKQRIRDVQAAMGAIAEAIRQQWLDLSQVDISPYLTSEGLDLDGFILAGLGHHIKAYRMTKEGFVPIFRDPDLALTNLAKHLGMFVERKILTGADGGPIETKDATEHLSDAEAGRRLLALLRLGAAEDVDGDPTEEQHLPEDVS